MGIKKKKWVRIEEQIVEKKGKEIKKEMDENVRDDLMSFMRRVNIMKLKGEEGIEYMRKDMEERERMS